jgi:hypothetical protein
MHSGEFEIWRREVWYNVSSVSEEIAASFC